MVILHLHTSVLHSCRPTYIMIYVLVAIWYPVLNLYSTFLFFIFLVLNIVHLLLQFSWSLIKCLSLYLNVQQCASGAPCVQFFVCEAFQPLSHSFTCNDMKSRQWTGTGQIQIKYYEVFTAVLYHALDPVPVQILSPELFCFSQGPSSTEIS